MKRAALASVRKRKGNSHQRTFRREAVNVKDALAGVGRPLEHDLRGW